MRKSRGTLEEKASSLILDKPGSEETFLEVPNGTPESASPKIFVEPPMKVMPTLPKVFKSLVDVPIDITDENRNPRNIIELLGNVLGITDYKTNMASFWFLDFIALQVLQHEATLDRHGRSIMVSWLAGEMKLIQEKKCSREVFLKEMAEIFIDCSEKLSRGEVLPHWDLMLAEDPKRDTPGPKVTEEEPKEREESIPKFTKRRASSRDSRSAAENRKKSSNNTLRRKSEKEKKLNEECSDLDAPNNNTHIILDVIMEATSSMYGNSFHYALILRAFVEPVLLHEYTLPFTFRTPRPVKEFVIEKDDKKTTKRREDSAAARKGKERITTKSTDSMKTKKNSKDGRDIEATPESQTSVTATDEEILAKKREFILPLMEAKEAANILEAHGEVTRAKNITPQKKKIAK